MSMQTLIQLMGRLDEIQHELLKIAKQKVEPIKKGNPKEIEALVRNEAKLIRQLEATEVLRTKAVKSFLHEQGISKEMATVSELLKWANEEDAQRLTTLQQSLLDTTDKLKRQNQFNQQLIDESLQFVTLSLDLMMPQKEDISYSPNERQDELLGTGRSLFDSKA
ncbi:flagellar protein FlgN [Bacillus sp. JCM 19034]|uniref:flagellar protein FlgN n=1 Tax=Bacillus sp. JCM 19034 TaxID=1481928 RepID=UPI00078436B2|nr:flagellar protein FlgN [Bacillus sp. JCM 19034]